MVDFSQEIAVLFHEAEREFLFVIIGSHVGHVHGQIGKIAVPPALQGFIFHGAHVTDQLSALGQKHIAEMLQLSRPNANLILGWLRVRGNRCGHRNTFAFGILAFFH